MIETTTMDKNEAYDAELTLNGRDDVDARCAYGMLKRAWARAGESGVDGAQFTNARQIAFVRRVVAAAQAQ